MNTNKLILAPQLVLFTSVAIAAGTGGCARDKLLLEATVARIDATGGTLKSADGRLTITVPPGAVDKATTVSVQIERSTESSRLESPIYAVDSGPRPLVGAKMRLVAGDEACPEALAIAGFDERYPVVIADSTYDPGTRTVEASYVTGGRYALTFDRPRLVSECGQNVAEEPYPFFLYGVDCPEPVAFSVDVDAGPGDDPLFRGITRISEREPTSREEVMELCTDYYVLTQVDGTLPGADEDYYFVTPSRFASHLSVWSDQGGSCASATVDFSIYSGRGDELANSLSSPCHEVQVSPSGSSSYVIRVRRSTAAAPEGYRFFLLLRDTIPDAHIWSWEEWSEQHDLADGGDAAVADLDAGLGD